MKQVLRAMLCVAALVAMSAGPANAQAIGQIFGKATDSSGGVLPGVTVTITGPALQQPLTQVTTSTGAYQFPVVPVGAFTVTFELSGFKRVARQDIRVTSGFNAEVNASLEVGAMTEEVTVSAAAPVVDTKKTTVGATFTADVLEKIPTARDPWQIINMTPGVQAGLNVGGSSSGQQVGLQSRGTSASVQWNLEGGSITDLSSNSSPMYFNFDSFEQISVTNAGGDASVQSSGLAINIVTKSGSNAFKGTVVGTFQNKNMQHSNVSEDLFRRGTTGFLSGAPVNRISNLSGEYGGPLLRNKLWWWVAADQQDINAGVVNYFDRAKGDTCSAYADAQRSGTLLGSISYADLSKVQECLSNDQTVIKNKQGKLNYQLNASHKFQYVFISDNKSRNARGANANTEKEATQIQTADSWAKFFATPLHQLTHTWIASDRLVFNTLYTYQRGGFYLDYQDSLGPCGLTKYSGGQSLAEYPQSANPDCLFNIQPQTIRTTGNQSRSLGNAYQTVRPSHEVKTDGTFFLTNVLGGDHSLKFGAGYRYNPVLTYQHISGGGTATVQCVGNALANCGDGRTYVPVGSGQAGLVPFSAVLQRSQMGANNQWWMWSGYIQDSYSYKRLRVNAGLRYDWQQSKYLGGCVPANPIRPDLLPAQCEEPATSGLSPLTGEVEEIQPFGNWSPRLSATYDLQGNGKTVVRASGSYFYATKITLANALSGLGVVTLTWGNNQSSGACSTAANASCWTDANRDGMIQANELIGTPSFAPAGRFNPATGALLPTGSSVSPDTKIGRTREVTVGLQRELIGNLAVGVDGIYRRFDNGTANYLVGYQPGAAGFPLSQIYSGPIPYTDPLTGKTANYHVVADGQMRPTAATVTTTRLSYEDYKGVDFTLSKRYSNKWQANVAVTLQTRNDFAPVGSFTNPTGVEYSDGTNGIARYLIKVNGSYDLPWGIMASTNLNINDGGIRTLAITGPGQVYGGVNASGNPTTITYNALGGNANSNTLLFEERGTTRFERNVLWDMGVHKTFTFRGGQNRLRVMLDGFNILNRADVLAFSSDNISLAGTAANPVKPSDRINNILPPRIFRIGATFSF